VSARVRIGTRGSALALWQARDAAARLSAAHPGLAVELVVLKTEGDRFSDARLTASGGRGVFVKEIQEALLARTIDLGVHSLKDLPTEPAAGTAVAAILERADPRDALVSRGGCTYARLVLGVPIRDLTGGFKCFRRWVLESLDLSHVRAGGYAFQIELTYRTLRMGGRVVELPITFTDRAYGESKMSRTIVLEAVREVPALRLRAVRGALLERPDGEPRVSLIP